VQAERKAVIPGELKLSRRKGGHDAGQTKPVTLLKKYCYWLDKSSIEGRFRDFDFLSINSLYQVIARG
jgi:hypothetical protein